MKQLLWSAIAVLVLVFPAQADEAKLVGKWRAEYALTKQRQTARCLALGVGERRDVPDDGAGAECAGKVQKRNGESGNRPLVDH